MNIKSNIPNLLTLSNLLCGVISIYAIHQEAVALAAYLILIAAVFDFFDGLVARALGVSGELGKQLDSLADVVSFGVAPVFLALHLLGFLSAVPVDASGVLLALAAALMAAFSAYRLAVFNLDTRQSDQFRGMPTPAVALFWVSLVLISEGGLETSWLDSIYQHYLASAWALALSCLAFCVLMVAPLPLIALKFKDYTFRNNVYRYLLVASGIVLLAIFAVKAVPIILLLYLGLSVLSNALYKKHGIQSSN